MTYCREEWRRRFSGLMALLLLMVCWTRAGQAQLHEPNGMRIDRQSVPAMSAENRSSGSLHQTGGWQASQGRMVNSQRPRTAMPEQVFQPPHDVPSAPQMYSAPQTAAREPTYLPLPGGYANDPIVPEPIPTQPQDPSKVGVLYDYQTGETYPSSPQHELPNYWEQGLPDGCGPNGCVPAGEWTWTLLPKDLLWESYVGGPREARLAQSVVYLKGTGWLWELEAGGRAGLLRYGSAPGCHPEGWQLDVWGGAFPRLNMNENVELDAVDFKVGVPLTYASGPFQFKLEWYHVSAHAGDEFLLRPSNAGFNRIDYLRDSIVLGFGYFATPDVRLYAEADYAYNVNGGSEPWHFQFGMDYAPVEVTPLSSPQPFFAVNGHIREEVAYSGGINVVGGVQWRGTETERVFRTGLHYYAGQSLQLSFINDYEEFLGWGMWLDF